MTLEEFLRHFSPLVKRLAWRLIKGHSGRKGYAGWFSDPEEELKDLFQLGMSKLIRIHDQVNFEDKGYEKYVALRIEGCMKNYIKKNIPHAAPDTAEDDCVESKATAKPKVRLARSIPFDDVMETIYEPEDQLDEETLHLLLFRHKVLSLLDEFMENLEPKARFMFVARFHDGRTFEQIGEAVGHGRETVSGRIREMVRELRAFFYQRRSWRLDPKVIEEYLLEADLSLLIVSEEEDS